MINITSRYMIFSPIKDVFLSLSLWQMPVVSKEYFLHQLIIPTHPLNIPTIIINNQINSLLSQYHSNLFEKQKVSKHQTL
tara:strand:+ start:768 stop:1007 length:240 start_codon:yes stop_codon:yes gene_type:complete